jgi:hypothetical protein
MILAQASNPAIRPEILQQVLQSATASLPPPELKAAMGEDQE